MRQNIPWGISAAAGVHLLRLGGSLLVVRLLYPLFGIEGMAAAELADRIWIVVLTLLLLQRYRCSWGQVGWTLQKWPQQVGRGVLWGLALLALSIVAANVQQQLGLLADYHPLLLQVRQAQTWPELVWPFFSAGVAAPVAEELLYRVVTFLPLAKRWGVLPGAVASAVWFGLMHFQWSWAFEMLVVGVSLALLYARSGSLLQVMVAHAVINQTKLLAFYWGIALP